jgi:hypothetical protein
MIVNGNVGIGTDLPSAKLDVSGNHVGSIGLLRLTSSTTTDVTAQTYYQSSEYRAATFVDASSNFNIWTRGSSSLIFSTSDTIAERMRITSDTAAFLRMASGTGGIQFNGDTAAANALDDYEEGTFTPTTAGDATGALGTSVGEYTKIGNVVHFRMACTISTNFTSNAIGGLPFTIGGSGSPTSVLGGLIVFNASETNIIGRMDTAVTTISFFSDNIVSSALIPTTTMEILRMSGTYRV